MGFRATVLAAGALFFVFTEDGRQIANDFLKSMSVETDIAKYDCDMVSDRLDGESLQNVFGGKFRIVDISSAKLIKHDAREISCRARVTLSNGTEQTMRLSVRRVDDDRIFYEARPL